MYSSCWPHFQLKCFQPFLPVFSVQDVRSDWGPLIVFHLWWHLSRIRIRNAVWNEIKFMHPLNTLAQLKCFFMNQQYHVAKRTKGLLDYVSLSCLYTPLNPHPVISLPPISVALHSSSVKALKIYVPHFLPPLSAYLKGHCPTYLPSSASALLCNAPVFPKEPLDRTFNPAVLLHHNFSKRVFGNKKL